MRLCSWINIVVSTRWHEIQIIDVKKYLRKNLYSYTFMHQNLHNSFTCWKIAKSFMRCHSDRSFEQCCGIIGNYASTLPCVRHIRLFFFVAFVLSSFDVIKEHKLNICSLPGEFFQNFMQRTAACFESCAIVL